LTLPKQTYAFVEHGRAYLDQLIDSLSPEELRLNTKLDDRKADLQTAAARVYDTILVDAALVAANQEAAKETLVDLCESGIFVFVLSKGKYTGPQHSRLKVIPLDPASPPSVEELFSHFSNEGLRGERILPVTSNDESTLILISALAKGYLPTPPFLASEHGPLFKESELLPIPIEGSDWDRVSHLIGSLVFSRRINIAETAEIIARRPEISSLRQRRFERPP
jgi:hypothetical protein